MFRTRLLSIIGGLNTVFTAIVICHTGYVDSLLAWCEWTVNITGMTNIIFCEYSNNTSNDGQ